MTAGQLVIAARPSARLRSGVTTAPPRDQWMPAECRPGLASVIIPTYNHAGFLADALDSVRAQTYRPIELIVVDDGSTDGTREVLRQWRCERRSDGLELRCFRQANQGAPVARNRGLIESRGEFIQFLDSDDLIGRTKLAASAARLRDAAPLSAAHGPWRCLYYGPMSGYGPTQRPDAYGPDPARLHAYLGGASGTPLSAYVFRRDVACAVGPWDESLRQRQDTDYIVRAILAGCSFVAEDESMVTYRRHGRAHIGHPGNFRRHFPSQLAVAEKWHAFLLDGRLPADAAPALRAYIVRLLMEAHVTAYAAGVARCNRRLHEWFGESPPGRLKTAAHVVAKRLLLRPLRTLTGEMPLAYAKALVPRRRARGGAGPCG